MRITKKLTALVCSAAMLLAAVPSAMYAAPLFTASAAAAEASGWFESAYITWEPVSGASGYNFYADGKQQDSMLIRQYNGYYRADALGMKAGSHTLKIVPLIGEKEDASKAVEKTVTVTAFDRTGFGWVNGTSSGAYNEDGTLRSGAVVLYVTEQTKDTVTMEVVTDSKGGKTKVTGIQNILTAYQKGTDSRPLDIRCIGNITDPATLMDGDLLIKGSGANKRLSCGVTIEGVGSDTVFNGFGLRLANCSNVEVRNIGFMNCNSGEGDDVGLQQNNDHCWVHNCDLFYGDAGSDADQVKGDGALDTKTSSYITHSYNHFWDNGKCNLQGMKSESTENYITYHHNWYDHSDSRHPRIRTCTVHIYNNYYDGNAKYGVGVTMGASAFVENNYFRACPKPMMSSMQGTDAKGDGTFSGEDGGIIKAYGNEFAEKPSGFSYITYQESNTSFDAYEVKNAKDTVPQTVKTLKGGTGYNNFDVSKSMYDYQADDVKSVPTKVTANAGRAQGGDFKWTFNNAVDDASYAVNKDLKAALVNYKSSIVAIGSGSYVAVPDEPAVTTQPAVTTTAPVSSTPEKTEAASSAEPAVTTNTPAPAASGYVHNFTENGTASTFYQIMGNLSKSKGTASYDGKTLTQCLKMESATEISFTHEASGTLTLVFGEQAASIKLDGKKYTTDNGILTLNVSTGGTHKLTKADSCNLFYMVFAAADMQLTTPAVTTSETTVTTSAPFVTSAGSTAPVVTSAGSTAPVVTSAGSTVPVKTTASVSETTAAQTLLAGDINCDGKVTVSDAILLARIVAEDKSVKVSETGLKNAELDGVSGLSAEDTTYLLKMIAGLI